MIEYEFKVVNMEFEWKVEWNDLLNLRAQKYL